MTDDVDHRAPLGLVQSRADVEENDTNRAMPLVEANHRQLAHSVHCYNTIAYTGLRLQSPASGVVPGSPRAESTSLTCVDIL